VRPESMWFDAGSSWIANEHSDRIVSTHNNQNVSQNGDK